MKVRLRETETEKYLINIINNLPFCVELHVLSVWVLSGFSSFLQQPKEHSTGKTVVSYSLNSVFYPF